MELPRRTVLLSLAAGAAAVGLGPGSPAQGAPNPSRGKVAWLAVTPVEVLPVTYYDEAFATETVLEVPVMVEIAGFAARRDALVATLTFDGRLLRHDGDVVLSSGGELWTAPVESASTAADGSTTLSFTVARPSGEAQDADVTIAALPLQALALYPAENVGTAAPFALTLARRGSAGRRAYRWSPVITTREATVWGAEVEAAWDATAVEQGGRDRTYRYPVGVRVLSVGPAPTPAGARVVVDLDRRLVEAVTLTRVLVGGVEVDPALHPLTTGGSGDQLEVTVTCPDPVPAGTALDLELACAPAPGTETVTAVRFASVTFRGTDDALSRPRATGRYTTTDLTPSGTPQSAVAASGTI